MILEGFTISRKLRTRLEAWQEAYDAQNPPQDMMVMAEQANFDGEGLNITAQLSAELGNSSVIEYAVDIRRLLFIDGDCVCIFEMPSNDTQRLLDAS